MRIRSAHDRRVAPEDIAEEWLIIEWPDDDDDETMKFWFSTLDKTVTFAHLVHTIKMRWRIERDYLELKQEVGLGHFEGRGWRGFHQSVFGGKKKFLESSDVEAFLIFLRTQGFFHCLPHG